MSSSMAQQLSQLLTQIFRVTFASAFLSVHSGTEIFTYGAKIRTWSANKSKKKNATTQVKQVKGK